MKIRVNTQEFLDALALAGSAVGTDTFGTDGIMVTAKESNVVITGNNIDQAVEVEVDAEVGGKEEEENDSFIVPYKLLNAVVRKFKKEDPFEFDVLKKSVKLKQGNSEYSISLKDVEAFPLTPEVKGDVSIAIPATDVVNRLIHNTLFATASPSDTRFTGIFLTIGKDTVKAVGTDSTMLSVVELPASIEVEEPLQIVLPRKAAELLLKMPFDTNAEMRINDTLVQVKAGKITLTSVLLNEEIPDFEQIVKEKEGEVTAEVEKTDLLNALDRLFVIAKQDTGKITLVFSNGEVKASAQSAQIGEGEEVLPFTSKKSIEMALLFNGKKLINGIAHVPTNTVLFHMSEPLHPVRIQGKDDASYLFVIMPQRP